MEQIKVIGGIKNLMEKEVDEFIKNKYPKIKGGFSFWSCDDKGNFLINYCDGENHLIEGFTLFIGISKEENIKIIDFKHFDSIYDSFEFIQNFNK